MISRNRKPAMKTRLQVTFERKTAEEYCKLVLNILCAI